jgi:hypothetical protein
VALSRCCFVIALGAMVACADPAADRAEDATSGNSSPPTSQGAQASPGTADGSPSQEGTNPADDDPSKAPLTNLGPSCDEDNPVTGTTEGTTDRALPEAILQFGRQLQWGCKHRHYHDTRQWDFIIDDPNQAARVAYMQKMNWTRAVIVEGAPGSGLEFLAMHRAMLGTLRDRFPAHADLFKGWATVPTESTAADTVPPGTPLAGAFWPSMLATIARLETALETFASEDAFGNFIDTQHLPTAADPLARTTEQGAGLHTYVHLRFDDARSPIRMQRFSRNLESETFYRLHGWVDRIWTQWRKAHGRDDKTDAAYGEAMRHACVHMGLVNWNIARAACTR